MFAKNTYYRSLIGPFALLGLVACGKSTNSDLDAVSQEIGHGRLKIANAPEIDESQINLLEDGLISYSVYANGEIDFQGFASFFGKENSEEIWRHDPDTWRWEVIRIFWYQLSDSFNRLVQINFQNKLILSGSDRNLLFSKTYKTDDFTYQTAFGAQVWVRNYDPSLQRALVTVLPKPQDGYSYGRPNLSFSDASIKVYLDLSGPLVKILGIDAKGMIQDQKVQFHLDPIL